MSSRQLPAGGNDVLKRSLARFKVIVTTPYRCSDVFLGEVRRATENICQRIKSYGGRATGGHISLSTSASYDYKVDQGGRGSDILENALPILLHCPPDDEEVKLDHCTLYCPKGQPRWRYWCRERPLTTWLKGEKYLDRYDEEDYLSMGVTPESHPHMFYPRTIDLGEELPHSYLSEKGVVRQGFDYALGDQIYCAALVTARSHRLNAYPMRLASIAEPGCKVRIVTITEWYVSVLQQGPAHLTRHLLSSLPNCVSSLTRSNQAWASLYLSENKDYPEGSTLLCSDLKEATDHFPFQIVKAIWDVVDQEFKIPGLTLASNILCSPRVFELDDDVIVTQRGSMMGEPLTKSTLTFHQLVAEEIAWMRTMYSIHGGTCNWRTFHVGGDDVLAIGPEDYLNEISEVFVEMGSEVSPDKHGIHHVVGRYTEKLLETKKLTRRFRVMDIINDYENHPWIESVKVRLLSPTSKSTEVVNDRNVAIGKARSLGKELRYLPESVLPGKTRNLIRDRFVQRMGPLLPPRTTSTYWHLLLPATFGGLDLYTDHDLPEMVVRLPSVSKWLIQEYLNKSLPEGALRDFKCLPRNASFRGYTLKDSLETRLPSILDSMGFYLMFRSSSFRELKKTYDLMGLPETVIASKLNQKGWFMKEDVESLILRPVLFSEILTGEAKSNPYNTERLQSRFGSLWEKYDFEPSVEFTEYQLRTAIKLRVDDKWFYLNRQVPTLSDNGEYVMKTTLEELQDIVPTMKLCFTQGITQRYPKVEYDPWEFDG